MCQKLDLINMKEKCQSRPSARQQMSVCIAAAVAILNTSSRRPNKFPFLPIADTQIAPRRLLQPKKLKNYELTTIEMGD
jgi:hypothetical protein